MAAGPATTSQSTVIASIVSTNRFAHGLDRRMCGSYIERAFITTSGMPRPPRQRFVTGHPAATVFKPAGVRARELTWTTLTLDEFEAIRLIDGEGMDQETVAERMRVSRPTVTRILAAARSKIAQTLAGGQALRIEGGPVIHRNSDCRHLQGEGQ